MKHKLIFRSILPLILFLALAPAASASSTWYVDGVNGNDSNDCLSSQTACQTIGHAKSLAHWGDTIMVAPATYTENLTIRKSLKIIGSDATMAIVDGNQAGSVFTIVNAAAHVHVSNLTIRNGSADAGGGINNSGTLTINNSFISGNSTSYWGVGGGVYNAGTLMINGSTVSKNVAGEDWHGNGGGIYNDGTLTIDRSLISGNRGTFFGGGIYNNGTLTIGRSTISGNTASTEGAAIVNYGALTIRNSTINKNGGIDDSEIPFESFGTLTITNSTISGNMDQHGYGGVTNWQTGTVSISNVTLSGNSGVNLAQCGATMTIQNSVVANPAGGNCGCGPVTSKGYNLSSDDSCSFTGPGDMNNTDPKLGKLKDKGGPTKTIRLLDGSPAIDAGNPNGCTDDKGNLLKTDQRGWARPGKYDTGGCDIGAFERQHD